MTQPTLNDTRTNQIIDAAITVFSQKGFHQARMSDVSKEAGVSKGTPYRYFKDKDALIMAVANKIFHQEMAALEMAHYLSGTAVEKLEVLLAFLVSRDDESEEITAVVYELYAMSVRRADVRQLLSDYLHASVELITGILKQGVAQGEFPPMNAEKTAAALMALLEGTVAQELYNPDTKNINEQLKFGVDLLLKGLQCT